MFSIEIQGTAIPVIAAAMMEGWNVHFKLRALRQPDKNELHFIDDGVQSIEFEGTGDTLSEAVQDLLRSIQPQRYRIVSASLRQASGGMLHQIGVVDLESERNQIDTLKNAVS